jgi:L-histidine N-alpha-methyltransferase
MASSRPHMSTQRLSRHPHADFAADVREGLLRAGQKELPSKYLYDEIGSALFEAICLLPEYGVHRAGALLLEAHASEIVDRLEQPLSVAELGSGSGRSTRWILEALTRRQSVRYYPIDISSFALSRCRLELGQLACVSIVGFERAYLDGLVEVAARRAPGEHLFVLFLGGTIGNFDRPAGEAFLSRVRDTLFPGDSLLLSTDLEKPASQIVPAYDDHAGVTAAFNLNLLARINRELDADFVLSRFEHVALYDETHRRIEMHLRSRIAQSVRVREAGIDVSLAEGETIWTESSHRFNLAEVVTLATRSGFRCDAQWVNEEWPFAHSLFIAV